MAQGFVRALAPDELTVVVNVGDDDTIYGAYVSDTVTYTLAGIQGDAGWGIAGDTFHVMGHLSAIGVDTSFRLGDRDLAYCLARTAALEQGDRLSTITRGLAGSLGVTTRLLPASDDPVRTRVRTETGAWHTFQDYFVRRAHRDQVVAVEFEGAGAAEPAPGVMAAINDADVVVVAPSNPPLSIWPMLAIPGMRNALEHKERVVAVSPLFGGKALKGPAAEVLVGLGLTANTAGILAAYNGLITDLVVDTGDAADADRFTGPVQIHTTDTRIAAVAASTQLARQILAIVGEPAAPLGGR
jgi:LPPG:FO 2-phospho-L-lactate transferase